jgi:feruloyl-CoA synthase
MSAPVPGSPSPAVVAAAPLRDVPLIRAELQIERRADGAILARHPQPLATPARRCTDWLDRWARETPDRVFMAQRDGTGPWHTLTYGQTQRAARGIAAALVARGVSAERPVAMLSGNDLGQALLALGAQYAGVPVAPISPAYALMSQDHAKLKAVIGLLRPGLVYVAAAAPFAKALAAAVPLDVEVVSAVGGAEGRSTVTPLADLMVTPWSGAAEAAHAAVGPDTIVKFMFTSGSTGMPKGVINTQRMLTTNAEMIAAQLPFVEETPPILVDWLPWSHTFAGNHNINFVLRNGGTFYIDEGRPMPGAIDLTIRNLTEIAPTVYFNVPRGFEVLAPALAANAALRKTFFSRLQALFYAGASLPQHIWDALQAASVAETGARTRFLTGYGSTETAPAALASTNRCTRSGMVGVPLPGVTLKLVDTAGKLEARLKGESITPGYWKAPEQTRAAFDDEGFYRIGDALKWADPADPTLGFLFDGRVAEDFKLTTGTWVSVGPLRADVIQALAPLIRDAVITGHDRDAVGALLIPDVEACRTLAGLAGDADPASLAVHPALKLAIQGRLRGLASTAHGSSSRIVRAAVLMAPLSLDAGEITDKGSINQRAVLTQRADLVEALYAPTPGDAIVVI